MLWIKHGDVLVPPLMWSFQRQRAYAGVILSVELKREESSNKYNRLVRYNIGFNFYVYFYNDQA